MASSKAHEGDRAGLKDARAAAQKKIDAETKDRETRTVQVRALRTGFYPADGRLRNEGDEFDYVLNKDAKGKIEDELPSWMEDVDGTVPTRSLDHLPTEQPTVFEVRGSGANAVITKK